jgi:hypothetical protein
VHVVVVRMLLVFAPVVLDVLPLDVLRTVSRFLK